jgi:hypothetical protein
MPFGVTQFWQIVILFIGYSCFNPNMNSKFMASVSTDSTDEICCLSLSPGALLIGFGKLLAILPLFCQVLVEVFQMFHRSCLLQTSNHRLLNWQISV